MLKKLIACLLVTTALQGALAAQLPEVTVYKNPDCGLLHRVGQAHARVRLSR
jgi:hypothetical protein